MSQFLFKWIFLLSIELIQNLEHEQNIGKRREELLMNRKKLWSNLELEMSEMKSLEPHGWIKKTLKRKRPAGKSVIGNKDDGVCSGGWNPGRDA